MKPLSWKWRISWSVRQFRLCLAILISPVILRAREIRRNLLMPLVGTKLEIFDFLFQELYKFLFQELYKFFVSRIIQVFVSRLIQVFYFKNYTSFLFQDLYKFLFQELYKFFVSRLIQVFVSRIIQVFLCTSRNETYLTLYTLVYRVIVFLGGGKM